MIKKLIVEGWGLVLQYFINKKYRFMPKKLKNIIVIDDNIVRY